MSHLPLSTRETPAPANSVPGVTEDNNGQGSAPIHSQEKPRQAPAKTAKEVLERRYAENAPAPVISTDRSGKRKRAARRKIGKGRAGRESQLMRMLKDTNPIMARAAQGAMAMPGPIQARTQKDQFQGSCKSSNTQILQIRTRPVKMA